MLAHSREALRRHPERRRASKRHSLYGLSARDFDALFLSQGRRCAICQTIDPGRRSFAVDHDHTTGRVRGILCGRCNAVLGLAKESVETLARAIRYLKEEMA